MIDNGPSNKMIELTSKAISINEELLHEEKKFVTAVSEKMDLEILESISDKISILNRKETLFIGATRSLLQKLGDK